MRKRGVRSACAAIAMMGTAVCAQPQSAPAVNNSLPPGLVRQGGVIMMQPIADSGEGDTGTVVFGGERKISTLRYLSAADHDLFTRAIDAAERGDWTTARSLADQTHDA